MNANAILQPLEPCPLSDSVLLLQNHLSVVSDPRGRQGKLHLLGDILAIAILGSLCGNDDAESLETWAVKEEMWLRQFLPLPHGIPSQDTYLRVLSHLCPDSFRQAFLSFVRALLAKLGVPSEGIAIDGKTLRGSRGGGKKPVHIVSALVAESGLVLGQVRTEEKSNEITAIPALLKTLSLEKAMITIDAMGCQTEIADLIILGKGDYLLGLKENQATLFEQTQSLFADAEDTRARSCDEMPPADLETTSHTDAGHGRIEIRTTSVCHHFGEQVPSAARWKNAKTLVRVVAKTENTSSGHISHETRFYISSRLLSSAQAHTFVRNHWHIENKLHWCLDVSMNEDACRIRTKNAAENFSLIRHFVINLLRLYKGDNRTLVKRRKHCDYFPNYRMNVLMAAFGPL